MSLPNYDHQGKTNCGATTQSLSVTSCRVLTGMGRSAIAVVAIDGPRASQVIEQNFRSAGEARLKAGQIRFGTWIGDAERRELPRNFVSTLEQGSPNRSTDDPGLDAAESVVVTPITKTRFEVHCHGGSAAVDRIVTDLRGNGVLVSDSVSHSAEKADLLIREAVDVLSRCSTPRTAAIAHDQVRGAMQRWASGLLKRLRSESCPVKDAQIEAKAVLRAAPLGERLAQPFRVVLIGRPNVGKSSLLNAIVGYDRSITFDQAGTTRDVLYAETVIDGWPVRLGDTAGLRHSAEPIEREGVSRARAEAERADLVLRVFDPDQLPLSTNRDVTKSAGDVFEQDLGTAKNPSIAILNKVDLVSGNLDNPALSAFDLVTSTLSGQGVEELLQLISERLCRFKPTMGQPVPLCRRQSDALQGMVESGTRFEAISILNGLLGTHV